MKPHEATVLGFICVTTCARQGLHVLICACAPRPAAMSLHSCGCPWLLLWRIRPALYHQTRARYRVLTHRCYGTFATLVGPRRWTQTHRCSGTFADYWRGLPAKSHCMYRTPCSGLASFCAKALCGLRLVVPMCLATRRLCPTCLYTNTNTQICIYVCVYPCVCRRCSSEGTTTSGSQF